MEQPPVSPSRKRPLKILLSARDPGATENIIQLLRLMEADPVFEPIVAASGTASLQMEARNIRHISFSFASGQDHIRPGEDSGPLLASAEDLFQRIRPDWVLVSLSSFGAGVDEALIAVSSVPVLALQDAWGDVNDLLGKTADLYLVLDEDARRITGERFPVATLATGMPKYLKYTTLDFGRIRKETRRHLGLLDHEKLLGWFGQSGQIPGYTRVFDSFLKAVDRMDSGIRVLVKPHPKFSDTGAEEASAARKSLAGRLVDLAPRLSTEDLLASTDLVVTPFSLCGLDHGVMSSMSPVPMGAVVYVMNNSAIRRFARETWGRIDFPIVGNRGVGTCLTSEDPGTMAEHFSSAMARKHAGQYHTRSRQVLPRFDYDAFRAILLDWKDPGGKR